MTKESNEATTEARSEERELADADAGSKAREAGTTEPARAAEPAGRSEPAGAAAEPHAEPGGEELTGVIPKISSADVQVSSEGPSGGQKAHSEVPGADLEPKEADPEPAPAHSPEIDPRGDLVKTSPGGVVEPGGMIPPYEGRTTLAHERAGEDSGSTAGLGQAVNGKKGLDLRHHTKGLGRKPRPGLVPAEGRNSYEAGVTTHEGGQSTTTGGLGQAVHGTRNLDLEHHTKGLGRKPRPGLVPARGRVAYGPGKRTLRERGSGRSLRDRIGLGRPTADN